MGTKGTGSFGDYPGTKKGGDSGVGDSSGGGKGGDTDRCVEAFETRLEEVDRCDYFKNHGSVPPLGSALSVGLDKRVFAETTDGELVGFLPTKYNYIAACIEDGHQYQGQVDRSATKPLVRVDVTITPA